MHFSYAYASSAYKALHAAAQIPTTDPMFPLVSFQCARNLCYVELTTTNRLECAYIYSLCVLNCMYLPPKTLHIFIQCSPSLTSTHTHTHARVHSLHQYNSACNGKNAKQKIHTVSKTYTQHTRILSRCVQLST